MDVKRSAAVALVVVGVGALGAGFLVGGDELPERAAPQAQEPVREVVEPSPSPSPTPSPSPSPSAVPPAETTPPPSPEPEPSVGVHLRIDALGVDIPVHALTPEDGVIDPPTMMDAYWISPYGEPGAGEGAPDNTVYIAAHSWNKGAAAFNPLLLPDHSGSALDVGDELTVDTPSGAATYQVVSSKRYDKGALPDATEVWEVHPDRLVLITCFQRDGGRRSLENLVVTAELV